MQNEFEDLCGLGNSSSLQVRTLEFYNCFRLTIDVLHQQLTPFTVQTREESSEPPSTLETGERLSLSLSSVNGLVEAAISAYGSQRSAELSALLRALCASCRGQKPSKLRWLLSSILSMAHHGHLISFDRLVRSQLLVTVTKPDVHLDEQPRTSQQLDDLYDFSQTFAQGRLCVFQD